MTDISCEVEVAAWWWANHLAGPVNHDNGDAFQSAFTTMASLTVNPRPTIEQIERFVTEFKRLFWERNRDNWERAIATGDMNFGSNLRGVHTDYGPGPVLREAALAAGIEEKSLSLLFPIKSHTWINPGSVVAQGGYTGAETEIYAKPQENQHAESE